MNRVMIHNIVTSIKKLRRVDQKPVRIGLAGWLRHEITIATTNFGLWFQEPIQG